MIAVLFDFIHPCHVEGKNVFLCDYNIRRKTTVKVNHVSPLIMGMDMFFSEDFASHSQKSTAACLKNSSKTSNTEACVFK